jgi:transcriptional regulator with XRE-family HTH domain
MGTDMNSRLRELRGALGMTVNDFAESIGFSRAAVSHMEKGIRSISDRTVASICGAFNVRESWIRDGEGAMFAEVTEESEHALYFRKKYNLDDLSLKLISSYMRMPCMERRKLNDGLGAFAASAKAKPWTFE